ncbi:DUF1254 domain-containing protein [Streptomyces lunaelactis]|uniref:DUF1254 domain-containing protein n=1 Tax=Streptomyces lunaelactis TaxID=1535768 RepID=UPI00211D4D87|nr:DUF1254 domain-containing protein [Streptomyces lunaelactis]
MSDPKPELVDLAAAAYIYGYPLVHDLSTVETTTRKGFGIVPAGPFNAFAHAPQLADASAKFVSVNNDTVYSLAQLDLSGGPLLLHVPDCQGAYYVLQFVDAWTNNFAYLGRRATGTEEATWLIAPPGWTGTPPEGVRVIDSPTAVASIVGRSACDGPEDMARITALQRQLTLTQLEPGAGSGLPQPDPDVPEPLRFFEQLRVWMADFPPAPRDAAYQDRFQPLGLLEEGPSPYVQADPGLVHALEAGLAQGRARLEAAAHPPTDPEHPPGVWDVNLHLFDYNVDHLGPGTLDEDRWKIPDRPTAHLTRAVAARVGLWGNHAYEAVHAQTFSDSAGAQLVGSTSYTLHFEQPPPVDAFWSVTMYDTPDYHLVDNPIGRYSIGDRTPGLVYGDDGSLTLLLQHERPADASNWLPAPLGAFRPVIRLYSPGAPVLDGSYQLPPIQVTA